jgi:polyisoprenoid-binding protein YceI
MKTTEVLTKTKWSIDQAHSEITFSVKHLMISRVRGSFKKFDASIYTNAKDFSTVEVDLWIDASSIDTGEEKRDAHLKSADFFDVAKHKQITFIASSIGKADKDGNHELWGELTMKGITRNVKLNAQFNGIVNDPLGNEKAGFSVSGKIDRTDWDLNWNAAMETGGIMVSDDVMISCEVELTNSGQTDLTMKLEPAAALKIV